MDPDVSVVDNSQALTLLPQPMTGQLQPYAPTPKSAETASSSTLRTVPAFLNKLYSMVNDSTTDNLIRWTPSGTSFIVPSSEKLGRELLPRFFKHSNFGSFVRQLNMYGFHKVPHLQQGVLRLEGDAEKEKAEMLEFRSENFQRDQPDLLYLIHRKKGAAGAINDGADGLAGEQKDQGPSGSLPPAALTKFHGDLQNLLGEVAAVKRHQAIISAELRDLQNTNRQLWHETIANRANHEKNGDMIDKILKFLAGVFGGRVLGEGGSNFSTGNIQAANTNSGLGLDSYNQRTSNFHDPTQASEPAINRKRVERHNSGLELVPAAKRQRLLLKDSPKKGASASSRANQSTADHNIDSYFEELHSDEDVPANTIRDDASTSVLSMTNSPVERPAATFEDVAANQGAGMPSSAPNWNIDNTTQQPVPVPPLNSNFPTDNYANGNFAIDWPAINSYLNDPNSSSRTNALPDYSSYNFPDPTALLQSIGYVPGVNSPAPLQPEGHDGLSIQPQNGTPLSSFALALSPQNGAYQSNQQQMHSYDSALDNAVSENARLKERMDSLNTAINKLVAQMPQSFDPSATSLPANNTYSAGIGDDFDFSQYLDHAGIDENGQAPLARTASFDDALAQYLGQDPEVLAPNAPVPQDPTPSSGAPLPSDSAVPLAISHTPVPVPASISTPPLLDEVPGLPVSADVSEPPAAVPAVPAPAPGKKRKKKTGDVPSEAHNTKASPADLSTPEVKQEAESPDGTAPTKRRSGRAKRS